jgi:hypothetical protein
LALWELPTLGALAGPLLPRLRALPVGESETNSHREILFQIERAVSRTEVPGDARP